MGRLKPGTLKRMMIAAAVAAALSLATRVVRGDEATDDWRTQDVAQVADPTPDSAPVVRLSRTTDPAVGAQGALLEAAVETGDWKVVACIVFGLVVLSAFGVVGVRRKAKRTGFKGGPPLALLLAALCLLALPACSPAQQRAWRAFGSDVSGCLVTKCHVAEIAVQGMAAGGWAELLGDELPCALGCLGSAVSEVVRGEDRQVASWYGTSNEVRIVPTYKLRVPKTTP